MALALAAAAGAGAVLGIALAPRVRPLLSAALLALARWLLGAEAVPNATGSAAAGEGLADKWRLPSHIVLLRHGESLGNIKESVYRVIPDWQIPLTERGKLQARNAGRKILDVVGKRKVVIYYSPYTRTVETLDQILETIPAEQVCIVQEEPRIREQDFGNYQDGTMKDIKKERVRFGRFFFRFPEGESGADVYDRVSSFFETLFRQFKRTPISKIGPDEDYVLVIVSHGITIRLFLMRWFHWTVRDFEKLWNPPNCEPIVLTRREDSLLYELPPEMWRRLGITHDAPIPVNYFQFPVHYCSQKPCTMQT